MARYEVEGDNLKIREIKEDNGGCGSLVVAFFLFIILSSFIGSSAEDKVDYWNGDKNCPIFTERADKSMVVFRKDSAREVNKKYENGYKLIAFTGYEVEPDGSYREYSAYGIFYNKSDKYYEIYYPETMNFPSGQVFTIKNDYQINVCKVMIDAASK